MLVLLYYLSQNPDFPESVKPLMGQLKNSEQMLAFLNDLSRFSKTFSTFSTLNAQKSHEQPNTAKQEATEKTDKDKPPFEETQKNPQSPTSGIADEFIEQILESYLKKH